MNINCIKVSIVLLILTSCATVFLHCYSVQNTSIGYQGVIYPERSLTEIQISTRKCFVVPGGWQLATGSQWHRHSHNQCSRRLQVMLHVTCNNPKSYLIHYWDYLLSKISSMYHTAYGHPINLLFFFQLNDFAFLETKIFSRGGYLSCLQNQKQIKSVANLKHLF